MKATRSATSDERKRPLAGNRPKSNFLSGFGELRRPVPQIPALFGHAEIGQHLSHIIVKRKHKKAGQQAENDCAVMIGISRQRFAELPVSLEQIRRIPEFAHEVGQRRQSFLESFFGIGYTAPGY